MIQFNNTVRRKLFHVLLMLAVKLAYGMLRVTEVYRHKNKQVSR